MDTLNSLLTIVLVLAVIFVPQLLAIYFSELPETKGEEFIPDGR